jgi:hypothetical protein
LCPVIIIATERGTLARFILRTAVRRVSWNNLPGQPAAFRAFTKATLRDRVAGTKAEANSR